MGYNTIDYVKKSVRAAAILTTSHVAGTVLEECHNYNQLIILGQWTKGSLTSLELKVEFSADGTNYYQQSNAAVAAGVSTLTLNEYTTTVEGNFRIPISISDRYIKISAKGTGTVTSSSLTLDAVLAKN